MKISNSMLDTIQSSLIIVLLALWTMGLGLAYVLKIIVRGVSRITSRQAKKTYAGSLVTPLESTLLNAEKRLS